eukprot:291186-Chlamydomonas_euryale.AAC.2
MPAHVHAYMHACTTKIASPHGRRIMHAGSSAPWTLLPGACECDGQIASAAAMVWNFKCSNNALPLDFHVLKCAQVGLNKRIVDNLAGTSFTIVGDDTELNEATARVLAARLGWFPSFTRKVVSGLLGTTPERLAEKDAEQIGEETAAWGGCRRA